MVMDIIRRLRHSSQQQYKDRSSLRCRRSTIETVDTAIDSAMDPSDLIVNFPQGCRAASQEPRRVSFANEVEVKYVANIAADHESELWYERADARRFKYPAAMIVKAAKRDKMSMARFAEANVGDTSVFLGLEKLLTDRTMQKVEYHKEEHRSAILVEQRRQLRHGVHDATALAAVSEETSEWSRKRARIIGLLHSDRS